MFNFARFLTPSVTPAEVYETLTLTRGGFVVLDVRTPYEYAKEHIEGCILLPEYEVAWEIRHIVPDRNTKIYVYCDTGNRGARVTRFLHSHGYSNAYNMSGGISRWIRQGFPVIKTIS